MQTARCPILPSLAQAGLDGVVDRVVDAAHEIGLVADEVVIVFALPERPGAAEETVSLFAV
jgi:hypothetical protein